MAQEENYTAYLNNVMSKSPEVIRQELDRLMTKVMKAQRAAMPGSRIYDILHDTTGIIHRQYPVEFYYTGDPNQ